MFPTYFAIIFLALLCISTGFKDICPIPSPGSDIKLQFKQQCIDPSQCLDQFPRESNSSYHPSLTIFTNTFIQTVCCSKLLREVFDFSQTTALEYSQFEYEYSKKIFESYDINQAPSLAEFSTRGIATNFDVLTMPLMVQIKANVIANFLLFEGILQTSNAKSLALSFAEITENNAGMNMTTDPRSKFRVIGESFLGFILSVDDDAIAVAPVIAFFLGNGWLMGPESHELFNK